MSNELLARLNRDYKFHPPRNEDDVKAHELVREACKAAAVTLVENVPPGRELSLALTKLEEASMHANAGLARARAEYVR